MSTSYTEGPWQRGESLGSLRVFGRSTQVCDCWNVEIGIEEAEANARLIAAAPYLLEAAKLLREAITPTPELYVPLARLDDAIKKAEGNE